MGKVKVTNRFSELLAAHARKTGRKWTYEDVSRATGVSTSTLSAYAQNKIRRYDAVTVEAFLAFFGCGMGDLFSVDAENDEEQPVAVAV